VLGVGPGKTTRLVETHSPVDAILTERGAKHVNVNLLRYFSEPGTLDSEARAFLQRGMALAMEWATQGFVVPHVSQTIDSTVEAINAGLQSLKAGRGILGKVAVIVDRDLAAGGLQKEQPFMKDNARAPADRDALPDAFAAELTRAAYQVALRHGAAGRWLDLELDLRQALADTVQQWGWNGRDRLLNPQQARSPRRNP
jgi:hypothetical protein